MSVSDPHTSFDSRGKKRSIEERLRAQKPINPIALSNRIVTSFSSKPTNEPLLLTKSQVSQSDQETKNVL